MPFGEDTDGAGEAVFVPDHLTESGSVDRPHAVSEIECRRGGLRFPSWLILDEYNLLRLDEAYDLASTTPIGTFSPAFVRKVATLIKQAAAQRRLRVVIRK